MIAKKTSIKRARGAAALAKYIAAAKEKGEKLEDFWLTNCKAGDKLEDLDMAIAEIRATQGMNQRSKADPNYHLIVSFAEGEKPDVETLKNIEADFAEALGLQDHQRVVGTHTNTENFHMHIQFNTVHPETYRMHTPYRDFKILQETAAKLEKKYGLSIVEGRGKQNDRENTKARDKEANTWEQSFSSYLQERKDTLLEIRQTSRTWTEFHNRIGSYGIAMKKRANGLVFYDPQFKTAVKASAVDRVFSKKQMEEKFGIFEEARWLDPYLKTSDKYRRKPLDPRLEHHGAWKKFKEDKGKTAARNWRRWLEAQAPLNEEAREALALQKAYLKIISGKNPQKVRTRIHRARKPSGMSR